MNRIVWLCAFALGFPLATYAHHGIANFDHNKDVEITGVISDIAFVNPHSWLYVDVTAADGAVTPWRCEMREIRIVYGFMDIERTIHLDMNEHPDDLEPSFAGHSIGWWAGDVLVVDTVGFVPGRITRVSNLRYSEQLHVVERFALDPDAMILRRDYVAVDPLYFVGEHTRSDTLQVADVPYQPYNCDDRTVKE